MEPLKPETGQENDFAFDSLPRGELKIGIPRRRLFSSLMTEIIVFNKKSEGHIGRKLTDLGLWADERLAIIAPVTIPGSKIEVKDGYVWGAAQGRELMLLFPVDSPAFSAFNLFGDDNTLSEITDVVRRLTGWTEEKSFAYVRGLFLSLVTVGLCQPKYLGE